MKKDTDLVSRVRTRTEESWKYDQHNRIEGRTDLRFVANQQWAEDELEARKGRPCLTINRLSAFLHQITNDIRQNKPSIKCYGVDGSEHDEELAEVYDGLIRQIENRSAAGHVYSHAASLTAACGIGHFRIHTDYVDDQSFDQEILIERITDPFAVYWDPAAVKPDRSDGMWCVVLESMPLATFQEQYPEADTTGVDKPDGEGENSLTWNTSDNVMLAEYWEKIPMTRKIGRINGQVIDVTQWDKSTLASFKGQMDVRDVQSHKVQSWIVSGTQVLSGPHDWSGRYIPIVTIVGDEYPVGDQIIRSGMIRHARDAQKMYNYWRSAAAETIGQAAKSKWIGTRKMFARDRALWDDANVTPQPYMTYDVDPDAPGGAPQRIAPPEPPSAMWQESQIAADDIKATTGIFDASMGAQSNETSGKAIMARQREGDTSNFHFTDNLKESLTHAGRILVDLIPRIYDTERIVRILGEDGSEKPVKINEQVADGNGGFQIINDMSTARYDVMCDIGPGYATRRLEAADSMMQFAQAVPNAAQVIGDLIAKNMAWPGADEIAERLKKMLPPGMAGDDAASTGDTANTASSANASADPNAPPAPPPPDPAQMAAEAQQRAQQMQQQQAEQQMQHQMQLNQAELEDRQLKLEHQRLLNAKVQMQINQMQQAAMQPSEQPNLGSLQ